MGSMIRNTHGDHLEFIIFKAGLSFLRHLAVSEQVTYFSFTVWTGRQSFRLSALEKEVGKFQERYSAEVKNGVQRFVEASHILNDLVIRGMTREHGHVYFLDACAVGVIVGTYIVVCRVSF